MSIFDKNISENLIVKIIEEFIEKLKFCLSVTYISFPFDDCSKQLFHLDFIDFIEIYEINWLKIKEICGYNVGKNDKKYLISKMINENLYYFIDLLEYVYNVISLLELDEVKYNQIKNWNSIKSKHFFTIKSLIDKIISYKNMKFIKIKNDEIISWKLVNYDINNIISINTLPDILDNHFNWKEIINDYFSNKNKGNIPKKHSLHKIISNSLESKRKEIRNFPCVEKEIFKFLNEKDIRHSNYVELTEKELDYQMKLILFAFTIIDL